MFTHYPRISKILFALFVLVILVYAFFEARAVLFGPQIVLGFEEEVLTVDEALIEIRGAATNVVEITLDGRMLFTDSEGAFTERLLLAEGVNRFVFTARDRFGNTREETLTVLYRPKTQRPIVPFDARDALPANASPDERTPTESDTIQEPLE